MLYYLIVFAIFAILLKLVDYPTVKKIKNANDSETALAYRKKLLSNRKIAFGILLVLLVIDLLSLLFNDSYESKEEILIVFSVFIMSLILLFLYLRASNKYTKVQGRVSTLSVSDFLSSNERFALFLRGFEKDIYNEKAIFNSDFSEEKLAKIIKKGLNMPLCAVGMTKEADSPLGGIRVYVDDNSWKEDVYELMCKAEKIIILVNDRDSCIWEIKKAFEMSYKCTFIIDDLLKYHNVKMTLADFAFPEIPDAEVGELSLEYDPRQFFFTLDGRIQDFESSIADYCNILGIHPPLEEKDISDEVKTPFYERPFFIFLIIIAIFRLLGEIFQ